MIHNAEGEVLELQREVRRGGMGVLMDLLR
jgi:hypothetical protein